jgi:hypothetical protein
LAVSAGPAALYSLDQAPELPLEAEIIKVIACFDADSTLAELTSLLDLWQQLWQGQNHFCLLLACLETHWEAELLEELIVSRWPQEAPDLLLLDELNPSQLPYLLTDCALYLSAAVADSASLLLAAAAGCRIVCRDSWFHDFVRDLPGVRLYRPGDPLRLEDLLAAQTGARQLEVPTETIPVSPELAFECLPLLQQAEQAFLQAQAATARSICLELLQSRFAHLAASIANPELLRPEELSAYYFLQQRLQHYQSG